jgi:hypothetical protein
MSFSIASTTLTGDLQGLRGLATSKVCIIAVIDGDLADANVTAGLGGAGGRGGEVGGAGGQGGSFTMKMATQTAYVFGDTEGQSLPHCPATKE